MVEPLFSGVELAGAELVAEEIGRDGVRAVRRFYDPLLRKGLAQIRNGLRSGFLLEQAGQAMKFRDERRSIVRRGGSSRCWRNAALPWSPGLGEPPGVEQQQSAKQDSLYEHLTVLGDDGAS